MSESRNIHEGLLDRPLTPRSIVASLLLGTHPPRLPAASLVRWCRAFGIAEGTTRVALSRMVAGGELTAAAGTYALAGPLAARQRSQDWALRPQRRAWTGRWRLGIVTAERRDATARAALRRAAGRARLAELREGVWGRPDNLPPAATPHPDADVVAAQLRMWTAEPDEDAAPLAVAAFDVDGLHERGRSLLDRLGAETDALVAGHLDRLAPAFVAGAAALQHIRRDPLLPDELLPAGWPGEHLRQAYARFQPVLAEAAGEWLR